MSQSLKAVFAVTLCLATPLQPGASAQQVPPPARVGENVNVLPVYKSPVESLPSDDYLRGDSFGQRQNEPSIAVSTVNKDHILTFYNDFRAVDLGPTEPALPGPSGSMLARAWNNVTVFLARLVGRPAPKPGPAVPEHAAAAEAWIGMSASYDGGLTWVGGLVPGSPEDDSPASVASPAHGLQGASDPVVVSAPCGKFFLAWLAFTRGGESRLLVSRFTDANDSDQRHTIRYDGTTVVEVGQNAANGHFLDKPDAAIELTGASGCDAFAVHVSYTTFVGKGGNNFTSKVTVASSTNGGLTFTRAKVDDSYTQSQGTALVTHPTNRQLHVFWRSFNPNTIVMSKRTLNGNWSKPADVLAGQTAMVPFDQPMLGAPTYAFRSNGFPAAAITPDGNSILVAWQELWDGVPRVVVKQVNPATGTGPARVPAAAGTLPASPPGLGFFNVGSTPAGPQVMPSISCTVDKCMLTYYEGRGALTEGWIAGFDRVLDLRGVIVTPGPEFTPSFQITRYGYQPPAGFASDGDGVIEWLDEAITGGLEGNPSTNASQICPDPNVPGTCFASLNYSGYPHTGGGTVPFMGDYNDVQPVVPFVNKGGTWKVPTLASDVPYDAAFVAAWADNRNVVPPTIGDWSNYAPPGTGATSCVNPGSRDQSVMTTQLSASGLLITAPTNYKAVPSGEQVAFPVTVWNNTGADVLVDLSLTGNATASLAKGDCPTCVPPVIGALRGGDLKIFAYSSSSIYVYVTDPAPFTVTTKVKPLPTPPALPVSAALTFNEPEANTGGIFANQATGLTVNPVPRNPVPRNPVPRNPVPRNPVPRNYTPPDSTTPYAEIYGVKDYSVAVSADDANPGDVGAYLALFNVDKAYQDSYVFQVFITKPTYAFEVVEGCEPQNRTLGTMVANISDPANPVPRNPVPRNPVPRNPVPRNPAPSEALVQNSTFTLGSSEAGTSGALRTAAVTSAAAGGCGASGSGLIAECTKAAPRDPNRVIVTLRAYQIKPDGEITRKFDPNGEDGGATPPSLFVADSSCTDPTPNCVFVTDGPDLAVASSTAEVSPDTVSQGSPVEFPSPTVPVANEGNREPTASYEIGFYLSGASTAAELPRNADGTIQTEGATTYTRLLKSVQATWPSNVESESLLIPAETPIGIYNLYAYVDSQRVISELDEDNNIVQGGPITVKLAQSPTTVSVQSSPATPVYGQPLTLTLTVTATAPQAGAPAPTGTVQVSDNGLALPGSPLPLGSGGSAVLQVENLGAGPHSITASYTPDAAGASHYLASPDSSPLVVTITRATPGVSVTGGTFTYNGAQRPASGLSYGVGGVTDVLSPAVTLNYAGTGSTTYGPSLVAPAAAGTYEVTASFAGNANYAPASGTTALTITQAAATVSVTGGVFSYDGNAHPATATANGIGGATVPGSFSFTYTPGGSAAPISAGQYSVTATLTSSDPNYGPVSGTGSITINKASTSTTLTASSNPSLLAKAVTLTAKVTAIGPGAGLPTGTATVKDGATTLGTVALANVGGIATATFTTSSLSAGSHAITATYGGDTSFLPSTSAPLTQTVSYVFSGFETPLTTAGTLQSPTASGTRSFGSVIPIKWQLTDGNGTAITDLESASPLSATYAGATCPGTRTATTVLLYSPTAGAAGGSTFRSGSSGFIFNWDATKNATEGCWWIRLKLADGSPEKVTTLRLP